MDGAPEDTQLRVQWRLNNNSGPNIPSMYGSKEGQHPTISNAMAREQGPARTTIYIRDRFWKSHSKYEKDILNPPNGGSGPLSNMVKGVYRVL